MKRIAPIQKAQIINPREKRAILMKLTKTVIAKIYPLMEAQGFRLHVPLLEKNLTKEDL